MKITLAPFLRLKRLENRLIWCYVPSYLYREFRYSKIRPLPCTITYFRGGGYVSFGFLNCF